MNKARYFAGYPEPRLRLAPLLLALLGVILAHPTTVSLAVSALQPIRKLPHEPPQLSTAESRVVAPAQGGLRDGSGYVCRYPANPHRDEPGWQGDARSPLVVGAAVLEHLRIAGDPRIPAPRGVRALAAQRGKTGLVGVAKMCVDRSGRVDLVRFLNSTGYAAYDRLLTTSMRRWRYRPYRRKDGTLTSVCTVVVFIDRGLPRLRPSL